MMRHAQLALNMFGAITIVPLAAVVSHGCAGDGHAAATCMTFASKL